ncbi:MAG: hypothetical protein M1826_003088 [Phylliscum demangeonii]|nr:MAG: hypothetical protein M1826_003088 [Phylliscum demangeonii]
METFLYWWGRGDRYDTESSILAPAKIGQGLLLAGATAGLQFFPANNPKIHYVGRWTSTPNRLRKDGAFPGVYFDLTLNSTSSLFLSLRNAATGQASPETPPLSIPSSPTAQGLAHVSFHSSSSTSFQAPAISLLVQIDQAEYLLLPNSSSLVTISNGNLATHVPHNVRIIAPMMDDRGLGTVQLEGLWLDRGGKLLPVDGSELGDEVDDEDSLHPESDSIGRKQMLDWTRVFHAPDHELPEDGLPHQADARDPRYPSGMRRPMLEIITDSPGAMTPQKDGTYERAHEQLLGGVMGWEYVLGEMFAIDHVRISVDGMCLTQECVGGTGQPAGMSDVFFRRQVPSLSSWRRSLLSSSQASWIAGLQAQMDTSIFNLGASDHTSFDAHVAEYNKTSWELFERFENSYVALIMAIRQLAYPQLPEPGRKSASASEKEVSRGVGRASIPIFIMRPFRGEFEHATQSTVHRLRDEGDTSVFWLDTTGWLDPTDTTSENRDFQLDESTMPPRWRLTERGNQRAAIFLHMHVCPYLAAWEDRCAFMPPEIYTGKVYSQTAARFDRYMEESKERRLKALFANGGPELSRR